MVATERILATRYRGARNAVCDNADLEAGFEKIAIYQLAGVPTHAARQLDDGSWTSKLGALEDVQHPLDGLRVEDYGEPVRYLKRRMGRALSRAPDNGEENP